MASFELAVALVLEHEGGYTPGLPGDPGGETNFGISKRAFPLYDIEHLTRDDATAIYRDEYWMSWMNVPDQQLANCLLDCAVNQGLGTCHRLYQPGMDLRTFQLARLLRYAQDGKPQFYHSWFHRVLDV